MCAHSQCLANSHLRSSRGGALPRTSGLPRRCWDLPVLSRRRWSSRRACVLSARQRYTPAMASFSSAATARYSALANLLSYAMAAASAARSRARSSSGRRVHHCCGLSTLTYLKTLCLRMLTCLLWRARFAALVNGTCVHIGLHVSGRRHVLARDPPHRW